MLKLALVAQRNQGVRSTARRFEVERPKERTQAKCTWKQQEAGGRAPQKRFYEIEYAGNPFPNRGAVSGI